MRVYCPGCSLKIVPPNSIKQLFAAENLSGVRHEKVEKFIFLVGKYNFLSIDKYLVRGWDNRNFPSVYCISRKNRRTP